jgi:hypothetical protein
MDDDHPTGEVRPVIVRDVLDGTETQGASVGMRFRAASATEFVPPEPCQSLPNGGSSASGAGKWGIPAKLRSVGS